MYHAACTVEFQPFKWLYSHSWRFSTFCEKYISWYVRWSQLFILGNNQKRAIIKNGYTRSVWSQNRVQPGIKSKIHSTSHAIGQKQIVPVFQRLWPGYTCKWLLCSAFNRFWLFVTPSICFVLYLVVFGFGRYFLLVFGLYLLFKFFTTSFISLYSTIMRTRLRRSIC